MEEMEKTYIERYMDSLQLKGNEVKRVNLRDEEIIPKFYTGNLIEIAENLILNSIDNGLFEDKENKLYVFYTNTGKEDPRMTGANSFSEINLNPENNILDIREKCVQDGILIRRAVIAFASHLDAIKLSIGLTFAGITIIRSEDED